VEMAEVQEETRGKAPDGSDLVFLVGETSFDDHHRHTFEIKPDGEGVTDIQAGHWHTVRKVGESIEVGPPIGDLQARVPVYGKIRFHNRSGTIGEGISVGQEWSYRKYIEGGTLAAAVWTFEDVTPERFPDGLPIELTLRVFRTHKGDMTRSVLGTIHVQNPDASARIRRSAPINFTSKEFQTDEELIPRQLSAIGADGSTVQEIDLFDDLTSDGRIEIWVRCAERAQYFGMAQGDVYLKATEKSFFLNFVRGYGGIWLQMLVVVSFGVMFSTFLSGPIAMLETLSVIVLGFCTQFVTGVFAGVYAANDTLVRLFGTVPGQPDEIKGGGPVESLIRLFTQKNLTVDLDISSVAMNLIRWVDLGLMCLMWFATKILPDFRQFDTSSHVAYGFNISSNLMGQNTLTTFGFVLVLAIVGYYFLKTREIAA
ncbi:MAG: hypothetical protein QF805_01855, partial [Pirellulaceae bacterium]|nr:hypothetical protein [Pirellulaceae bacterium]